MMTIGIGIPSSQRRIAGILVSCWCYHPGSRGLGLRRSMGAAINTTLALAPVTAFCGGGQCTGKQCYALSSRRS